MSASGPIKGYVSVEQIKAIAAEYRAALYDAKNLAHEDDASKGAFIDGMALGDGALKRLIDIGEGRG